MYIYYTVNLINTIFVSEYGKRLTKKKKLEIGKELHKYLSENYPDKVIGDPTEQTILKTLELFTKTKRFDVINKTIKTDNATKVNFTEKIIWL